MASGAWTNEEAKRVIEEAIRRGKTDLEFRKLALSNPTAAIEKVAGKKIPSNLKIKFFDGSDAHLSIVLPPPTSEGSGLSEVELEQVAGGGRCAASCAASCAVTSTVGVGIPGVGAVGGCV